MTDTKTEVKDGTNYAADSLLAIKNVADIAYQSVYKGLHDSYDYALNLCGLASAEVSEAKATTEL